MRTATRRIGIVAASLLGAAAIALLLRAVTASSPFARQYLATALVVLSLTSTALLAFRQWRHYDRPLRQLRDLLTGIRNSEIPIDELASLSSSGLAPVIPLIQESLRDVRRQRLERSVLSEELRQRVNTRTSALERQLGSLRNQANRDPLTSLLNRRALDAALPALIEQALTEHDAGDLCLLMMDVDHFKPLNDTRGHAAGDDFLKSLGQLLRSATDPVPGALAFRLGGDEFLLLLPHTAPGSATRLADRLSALVDQLAKPLRADKPPSLSIGLTALSTSADKSPSALLHIADTNLYATKHARKCARAA